MTTISLSATDALLDLMPSRAALRNSPTVAPAVVTRPMPFPATVPLLLRLVPKTLLDALVRRARQRELEMAFARLAETSPHLLADIGATTEAVRAAAAPGPRTTPAPMRGAGFAAASRSLRRLPEPDARPLAGSSLTRAQARQVARRPAWNSPDHWLR